MVRKPAVAGQFYPGSEKALRKEIESLIDASAKKEDAIGAVSPHAGYVYSGRVAGITLSSMKPRSTYIIIGPNHTGLGGPFSLSGADSWLTPLGEVEVDKTLRGHIMKDSRYIKEDDLAHSHEHSVEVQLPFLQVLAGDFKFVGIVVSHSDVNTYRLIGKELAACIKKLKMDRDTAIIASSDMTHYESHESAKTKDSKAIEALVQLDEKRLIDIIEKFDISMCGYAPAAVMLAASKELGAKAGRLVEYQTSGDASGDYSSVVGYAGILVS